MEGYQRHFEVVSGDHVTLEESQKGYSDQADIYEKEVLEVAEYLGPKRVAKLISECYPPPVRSSVKILDVGAGTGLVGIELKEEGFSHIDALDPNAEMLAKAKERGIYEKYFIEFLTRKELDLPMGTYDGLTTCGSYTPGAGHIPVDAFYEMIRLVKSGGYITIGARNVFIESPIREMMKKLETEGRWRQISRVILPNHVCGHDGFYTVFQVL